MCMTRLLRPAVLQALGLVGNVDDFGLPDLSPASVSRLETLVIDTCALDPSLLRRMSALTSLQLHSADSELDPVDGFDDVLDALGALPRLRRFALNQEAAISVSEV